jgi:release factor glutamine methyltransferase
VKNWPVSEAAPSLESLIQHGAAALAAAGIPEPRREAWRVWTGLMPDLDGSAWLRRAEPVSGPARERFEQAIARRARGEPLAYVTGQAGFRRLTLRVDRRALIPRPETEGLVDLVLARQPTGVAVDVGTGSGCLALALADEGRYRLVIGIERSRAALALARENLMATGLRVALVAGDLVEACRPGLADVVVANPPYLAEAEYATLDAEVRDWEPRAALVSGPDGLEATRRLLPGALRIARPGGWLALEVDLRRAGDVARLATAAGWREATVHLDLFGRARYVLARRSEAE